MPDRKSTSNPHLQRRRSILKALAAAPLMSRGLASHQPSGPAQSAAQVPAQPAAPPATDALTEVIRLRYPGRLSEAQLNELKLSIAGKLRTSERLRTFKLLNREEPEFVFRA